MRVDLGLERLHEAVRAFAGRADYLASTVAERRRRFQDLIRADGIRRVRLCADDRCRDAGLRELINNSAVVAEGSDGPGPVRLAVAVDRFDRPVQLATAAVKLESYEPNGPGCGQFWRAERRLRGIRLLAARG